uniref:2-oxoacid:ferredoxin oxidoreductase subunit gamma n=1 Tax=Fervidicoccus fontis TaxID=683846 RepID=A0A7J3ZM18_9CREN
MRWEVLIGGSGGQGIVTAGIVLGRAASLYEGLYAVQSQLYGPESRGGASRADVIISSRPIYYPRVISPIALILLSQQAYDSYVRIARDGAFIILDTSPITKRDRELEGRLRVYGVPLSRVAEEKLNSTLVVNMLSLGLLARVTGIVKLGSLERAVSEVFSNHTRSLNVKALKVGFELIE